jgi:hypothetical protein
MTHNNEFQSSGTSPSNGPDFTIRDEGSILLLTPHTEPARKWIDEHLPEDRLTFAGAVVVEHRYIRDIVAGILRDGLRCS